MLDLHVRKIKETPYKLVMNGWNVLGIFERRDNKEAYVERKNFTAAHKKIAASIRTEERLEKASK